MPKCLCRVFRYGKFAYPEKVSKLIVEVPKSTFKHFYVFAIIFFTYIFYMTTCVFVFGSSVPKWVEITLNIVCGTSRTATSKLL